jgi:ActR/RegA family two-component response regulator
MTGGVFGGETRLAGSQTSGENLGANDCREASGSVNASPAALRQGRGSQPVEPVSSGRKLLVLEDDYIIGEQLASDPLADGYAVSGPHASVEDALEALKADSDITAAILDLNLNGRIAFDLAAELVERKIPYIFYTGYESAIVPEAFRDAARVTKPAPWPVIRRALEQAQAEAKNKSPERPDPERNFLALLPLLRQRARQITPTEESAETLVERALERAIEEIESCPADVPVEKWLVTLLETTGIGERRLIN